MISLSRFCTVLGLISGILLCGLLELTAQDKKGDPFAQKKKADPPGQKKKDAPPVQPMVLDQDPSDPFNIKKKGPEKKDVKAPEDYPYYHQSVEAKIRRISGAHQDELTIEVRLLDPMKVAKFQEWNAKQLQNIAAATTPKEQFDRTMDYQKDLPAKQADIFTIKEHDVRTVEKTRVRSIDPPQEFDDKGFLKKWTPKELAAMKGNTKLPGYPVSIDAVRVNQRVQVYLLPAPKAKTKVKRGEDDPPPPRELPEAVLIIIAPQQ